VSTRIAGLPDDSFGGCNLRVESQTYLDTLDEEWIALLKTAKNMGISLQEIRDFLDQHKQQPVYEEFEKLWG
jgi:hypothetical protein